MTNKLYEVTLIGGMSGADVINRWNYLGDINGAVGGGAAGLVNALGLAPDSGNFPADTMGEALQVLTSNVMQWFSVLCRNIYDPTDFIDLPYTPIVTGDGTGEVQARFVSFGFKTNRKRLDIHRGYKRISGVLETATGTLGDLTPTYVENALALAEKMSESVSFTDGTLTDNYAPCIAKRLRYTAPSGKPAYKYYPEDEQFDLLMTGITWTNYANVRSQVSRQLGKGS